MKQKNSIKSFKLKLITNYKKEHNKNKNKEIRESLLLTLELFNNKIKEIQEFFILCKQESIKTTDNNIIKLTFKSEIQTKLINKIKEIQIKNNTYNSYMYYEVNKSFILNTLRKFYDILFNENVKVNEHGIWATFLFGKCKGGENLDLFKDEKNIDKKLLLNDLLKLNLFPVFSSYKDLKYKKRLASNIRFEKDCLDVAVQNFKSWRSWEILFKKELNENYDKYDLNNYINFSYANIFNSTRFFNYEYKDINRNILNYSLKEFDNKLFIEITLLSKDMNNTLEYKDYIIQVSPSKQKKNLKVIDKNLISYEDSNKNINYVNLGGAKIQFDKKFLQNCKTNKNYPGNVYICITESQQIEPPLNSNIYMGIDLGVRNYAAYSIVEINDKYEIIKILKSGTINLNGDKVSHNIMQNRNNIILELNNLKTLIQNTKELKFKDKKEFNNQMINVKQQFKHTINKTKNNTQNDLQLGVSNWSIEYFNKIKNLYHSYMNIYNKSNQNIQKYEQNNKLKKLLEHINNIKQNRLKEGCNKIIQLVLKYNCKTIIFEDLSKFKVNEARYTKTNSMLNTWAIGKTTELLEQNCKFYNINLKTINPMYTSKIDNNTNNFGLRFNKINNQFQLSNCGKYFISINQNNDIKIQNSDINASMNIIKFYLFKLKNKKSFTELFYKKIENNTFIKDIYNIYDNSNEFILAKNFYSIVEQKIKLILNS